MGLDDIYIIHRLLLIPPWTDSSGTIHSPPSSIIAKFVKRDTKETFYRERHKLKSKTTRGLGLASDEGNNICIAESLTQARRKLFLKSEERFEVQFHFYYEWYKVKSALSISNRASNEKLEELKTGSVSYGKIIEMYILHFSARKFVCYRAIRLNCEWNTTIPI